MSTVRRGQEQAAKVQPPERPSTQQEIVDAFLGPGKARVIDIPPTRSIPQAVTYQQVVDALAILGIDPNIVMSLQMRRRDRPFGSGGHAIIVELDRIPGFPRNVRGEAVIHVDGAPARMPSLHVQWAALENDGTWTSGADETRAEAEEIVASRPETTTLARRWVGRWEKP